MQILALREKAKVISMLSALAAALLWYSVRSSLKPSFLIRDLSPRPLHNAAVSLPITTTSLTVTFLCGVLSFLPAACIPTHGSHCHQNYYLIKRHAVLEVNKHHKPSRHLYSNDAITSIMKRHR